MDSIPLVAITGQVYSKYIGKMAFQETDFFGLTLPVVKHSYLVLDVHDLPRVFKEAFHLAKSGRPGPVVIDIPKDVQQARFTPVYPADGRVPERLRHRDGSRQRRAATQIIQLISEARRPMLYVGGGIISAGAHEGTARLRGTHQDSRGHDAHGPGRLPREPSAFAEMVRHARHGLRQLGGGPERPAAGVRRALRRPHHRRRPQIRPARQDRPHRHRRLRAQQEQARPARHLFRHQVCARPPERTAGARQKFAAPDTKAWHDQIAAWKRDNPFRYEASPHIQPQEAMRRCSS